MRDVTAEILTIQESPCRKCTLAGEVKGNCMETCAELKAFQDALVQADLMRITAFGTRRDAPHPKAVKPHKKQALRQKEKSMAKTTLPTACLEPERCDHVREGKAGQTCVVYPTPETRAPDAPECHPEREFEPVEEEPEEPRFGRCKVEGCGQPARSPNKLCLEHLREARAAKKKRREDVRLLDMMDEEWVAALEICDILKGFKTKAKARILNMAYARECL